MSKTLDLFTKDDAKAYVEARVDLAFSKKQPPVTFESFCEDGRASMKTAMVLLRADIIVNRFSVFVSKGIPNISAYKIRVRDFNTYIKRFIIAMDASNGNTFREVDRLRALETVSKMAVLLNKAHKTMMSSLRDDETSKRAVLYADLIDNIVNNVIEPLSKQVLEMSDTDLSKVKNIIMDDMQGFTPYKVRISSVDTKEHAEQAYNEAKKKYDQAWKQKARDKSKRSIFGLAIEDRRMTNFNPSPKDRASPPAQPPPLPWGE